MADQFYAGETFANGQQVDALRLNNHVAHAILLAGAVTEQAALTANTVDAADGLIIHDASASALRKATAGDILGSGVPIVTSSVTAVANKDVFITPYDGAAVTGSTYVSADAITVTVTTAVAHGLSVNQVVQIYGAGTGYSGVFKITAVTSLTFTYVISSLYSSSAVITTIPTLCNYYTKATNRVSGHSTLSGNLYSNGVVTSYLEVNTQALLNTTIIKGAATFTLAPLLGTTPINPRLDYFVQTRTQAYVTTGWGGLQNLGNIYGVKITPLDITFTPQKAGNKVLLTWTIFGEGGNNAQIVFLVTRTPNSGVGAGVAVALPDAVDASNNTWSGVAVPSWDNDESSTPSVTTVRILDNATLDVGCTYSVHIRSSANAAVSFQLNRTTASAGSLIFESGMSLGHAHEIYT